MYGLNGGADATHRVSESAREQAGEGSAFPEGIQVSPGDGQRESVVYRLPSDYPLHQYAATILLIIDSILKSRS